MRLLTYRCPRINMQEIAGLESSAMENEHRHTKEAKNRHMTNRRMTNREQERVYGYFFTVNRQVVHVGITNSPRLRFWQHVDHCPIRGWRDMYSMTGPLTEEEASEWEDKQRDRGAPTEGYFPWGFMGGRRMQRAYDQIN